MIRTAIVEDDSRYRAGVRHLLNRPPEMECVGAWSSAEECLALINAARPEVLLMDINLPGVSGVECVSKLRRLAPGVHIIMLTIEEDSARVFESLKAGATGYLVKNAPTDSILEAIREVHSGGAPMSSHIARMVVFTFRAPSPVPSEASILSPRESDILTLLSKGMRTKEIADHLSISPGTVNTHIRHIYEKLHVRSRAEAVARMLERPR